MENKLVFPKRTWVIRAFVVFLIVMALLTFFSNTIMNMSLAEVTVQRPRPGSLSASIKGEGTVTAVSQDKITLDESRKIESVLVNFGDEVDEGDLLMTLVKEEENEALEEAETALKDLQQAYDFKKMKEKPFDYSEDEDNIQELRKTLADANRELAASRGKRSLQNDINYLTSEVNRHQEHITALQEELAGYEGTPAAVSEAEADAKAREQYFQQKRQAYNRALSSGDSEAAVILLEEMNMARTERDTSLQLVESLRRQSATYAQRSDLLTQWERAKANIDARLEEKETALAGLVDENDALDTVVTAQKSLDKALKDFEEKKKDDEITDLEYKAQDEKELAAIEKAEKEVDKLRAGFEKTEIKAPAAGMVSSVNVREGDETTEDQELIVIDRDEAGHKVEISFPIEEAQQFHIGMEARIENYYGAEGNAVITSIRVDQDSPASHRKVTFGIKGTFYPDTSLTLSLVNQSTNYECIVPAAAIRKDGNGQFVFVMRQKSTPLGQRYTAFRVEVNVLATQGNNTAIDPAAVEGLAVITESNKPIESGDSVRVSASNT